MFSLISPKSRLAKRVDDIANYYRNKSSAKGTIQRTLSKSSDTFTLRIKVTQLGVVNLTFNGFIKGAFTDAQMRRRSFYVRRHLSGTGRMDVIYKAKEAEKVFLGIIDKYFKHVPKGVPHEAKIVFD